MKVKRFSLIFAGILLSLTGFSQKNLTEGKLVYSMSVETGSGEPKMADMLDGATTTIYLKGKESRVELVSGLGTEASVYDESTGKGFILKDYSGQKLMITLSPEEWKANNAKYEGIVFDNTGETSVISGFSCRKAIAKLKNGTNFTVWYTTEVALHNKSYDPQFTTLPGLAVKYEMEAGKMKLKFTLTNISYSAVPAAKFQAPKSGYRVMTFEETKNKNSF